MDSNEPYIPEEFELDNPAVFATLITLVLLTGIVANILALVATRYAIKSYGRYKITIPTFLIHCLMAVDLFSVLVFFFRRMLTPLYRSTSVRCDLENASNLLLSWLAGLINALMCLERCVAMTAPFYYHSKASIGKAKVTVVIVIIIALVLSMLPVVGFGSYKVNINGTYYCIGPGDIGANVTEYDFHFAVLYLVLGIGIVLFIQTCNAIVVSKILEIRSHSLMMKKRLSRYARGRLDSNSNIPASGPVHTNVHQASTKRISNRRSRWLIRASVTTEDTTSSTHSTCDDRCREDSSRNISTRSRSRVPSGRKLHPRGSGNTEVNIAKQIVVVSAVFTLSWLPFYVSSDKLSFKKTYLLNQNVI